MKKAKLDKQLAAYSTAAGAVLIGASAAKGGTIQYTSVDLTLNGANTQEFIDVDGVGGNELMFSFNASATGGLGGAYGTIGTIAKTGTWFINNLSADAVIDSNLYFNSGTKTGGIFTYHSASGWVGGHFSPGNTGYVGFRFDPGDGTKYGWVHIDSVAADSYHIDGYAYQADGSAIAAGAIPEPSSLVLLAAGAAGMYGIRRRLMI